MLSFLLSFLRDQRRRIFRCIGLWFMRHAGPTPPEALARIDAESMKLKQRLIAEHSWPGVSPPEEPEELVDQALSRLLSTIRDA